MIKVKQATKKNIKLRLALIGPSGSGKTLTAMKISEGLVPGGKVLIADTENESASLYSDKHKFDTYTFPCEKCEGVGCVTCNGTGSCGYSPERYIEVIRYAEQNGYDVLIIDSLSHAWTGTDGVLQLVDKFTAKASQASGGRASTFTSGWKEASPLHQKLIDAILRTKLHLIVTMRVKTEYVTEKDDKGRTTVRKVGLQPVQREGMEYEFDMLADLDLDHVMLISKSRCSTLDGRVIKKPDQDVGKELIAWLNDGQVQPAKPPVKEPTPTPEQKPEKMSEQLAETSAPKREPLPTTVNSKDLTPANAPITNDQTKLMHVLYNKLGITDREERLAHVKQVLAIQVESSKQLLYGQASYLIGKLQMQVAEKENAGKRV